MAIQGSKVIGWFAVLAATGGMVLAVVFHREARRAETVKNEAVETAARFEQEVAFLRNTGPVVAPETVDEKDESTAGIHVDQGETIRALEERIRAKDEQLAMMRAQLAASSAETPSTNQEPRRSWMDDIRENDPERYEEIMQRREAARQEAKYEIARKAAHFLQRDVDSMSGTEADEYAEMMNLLGESMQLTEQLNTELSWDERRELMRNLRDNLRSLSPMLESERDREFFRIGKDMGYSDEDATAFAAYLTDVVNLTSVQSVFRSTMQAMWGGTGGPWGRGEGSPGRPD